MAFEHVPVLIDKIIEGLADVRPTSVIVDCTLGLGGYTNRILSEIEGSVVIGLDQDQQALELAKDRLRPWGERFVPCLGNFSQVGSLITQLGFQKVDALVADLGVSNLQITEGDRGFSFRLDGPLDMRMNQSGDVTACNLVNHSSEAQLADIFFRYGEERFSRQIARKIVELRRTKPLTTTMELADVVTSCYPSALRKKHHLHPARKVFQSLRIAVNNELTALEELLQQIPQLLTIGGRALIVSYHSLEDRLTKVYFRKFEEQGLGKSTPRKSITPDQEEIEANPKSRSARLRIWARRDLEPNQGRQGPWRR